MAICQANYCICLRIRCGSRADTNQWQTLLPVKTTGYMHSIFSRSHFVKKKEFRIHLRIRCGSRADARQWQAWLPVQRAEVNGCQYVRAGYMHGINVRNHFDLASVASSFTANLHLRQHACIAPLYIAVCRQRVTQIMATFCFQ